MAAQELQSATYALHDALDANELLCSNASPFR